MNNIHEINISLIPLTLTYAHFSSIHETNIEIYTHCSTMQITPLSSAQVSLLNKQGHQNLVYR